MKAIVARDVVAFIFAGLTDDDGPRSAILAHYLDRGPAAAVEFVDGLATFAASVQAQAIARQWGHAELDDKVMLATTAMFGTILTELMRAVDEGMESVEVTPSPL